MRFSVLVFVALWAGSLAGQPPVATCLVEGIPVACGSEVSFQVDAVCAACPVCPGDPPAEAPYLWRASVADAYAADEPGGVNLYHWSCDPGQQHVGGPKYTGGSTPDGGRVIRIDSLGEYHAETPVQIYSVPAGVRTISAQVRLSPGSPPVDVEWRLYNGSTGVSEYGDRVPAGATWDRYSFTPTETGEVWYTVFLYIHGPGAVEFGDPQLNLGSTPGTYSPTAGGNAGRRICFFGEEPLFFPMAGAAMPALSHSAVAGREMIELSPAGLLWMTSDTAQTVGGDGQSYSGALVLAMPAGITDSRIAAIYGPGSSSYLVVLDGTYGGFSLKHYGGPSGAVTIHPVTTPPAELASIVYSAEAGGRLRIWVNGEPVPSYDVPAPAWGYDPGGGAPKIVGGTASGGHVDCLGWYPGIWTDAERDVVWADLAACSAGP